MAKCGIITLTEHSDNVDNFSLYSDADGYTTPFETGISRSQLLAGYQTILIPDAATVVRVRSTDVCVNYVDVGIVDITPTPTVSATPAASPTPPISPSPSPSTSPGLSPTPTPSVTPSISVSPSPTPSISVSATPTPTPSITPTEVLATTEYSYRALYPCADPLHCEPDYSNNCGSITWWDEYGQEQYDDEICSDLYNDETPYVVNSSQTPVVVAMVPV